MYVDYYSLLMFGVAAVFLTIVVWGTVQFLNELKWKFFTFPELDRMNQQYRKSEEDTGEVQAVHPKEEVEECVE